MFLFLFKKKSTHARFYNSSFVTIILKVVNVIIIKYFRHICLIGVQYKTIAKLFANRLANMVWFLVNMEQHVFVKGR